MTLYTTALYLVHMGVGFAVKDFAIASVDAINTLISLLLGISIARMMILDRLECFEASRLLKQERETDALTTISNRASSLIRWRQSKAETKRRQMAC